MNSVIPDISVIIPQRNHISTLKRLTDSIPYHNKIEIIIVDNQKQAITLDDIKSKGIDREIQLCHSEPERFAGGARNVGIDFASGKWFLFADADDYFTPNAFDLFLSKTDSSADIIYTCMTGWNDTTKEYCNRGELYTHLVQNYLSGNIDEKELRYLFHSPCCKMIRKELVDKYHLRFSEVQTGNDALFSVMTGHYARSVEAIDLTTYVATLSGNNISRKYDFESVLCRYTEDLKINQFLRRQGQWRWQLPLLETIRHYGPKKRLRLLALALKYRQPLLIDYYTRVHF